MEMKQYSDEFILSQYKYYKSLEGLPSRVIREAGTINQLATDFELEAKKRGLL